MMSYSGCFVCEINILIIYSSVKEYLYMTGPRHFQATISSDISEVSG